MYKIVSTKTKISRYKEISNIEMVVLFLYVINFRIVNSDTTQNEHGNHDENYDIFEKKHKSANSKFTNYPNEKDVTYDLYGGSNPFVDKTTDKQITVDDFSEKSVDSEYVDNINIYANYDVYNMNRHVVQNANSNGRSKVKLSNRIIQTRYGRLQGIVYPMDQHRFLKPVEVFLGVPYATPPIGSNRFSPTRTPSPWEGIRLSDHMGQVCPQRLPNIKDEASALERMPKGRLEYLKRLLPYLKNQSEDCLYMNIYAPLQYEVKKTFPVIVYVHGESFEWNSGNPYDGSVMAGYSELIVVTFNYRLGLLGFLNANPAPHVKPRVANYGLMDQIAALHWLQQNIAQFGGDPSNITMIGHGSGAACINFLLMSPTVMNGLFHRAVLMSGSALSSWALVEDPVSYSIKLAQQMNCSIPDDLSKNHEDIVDCLRELPIETLLNGNIAAPSFLSAFGPSVDGVVIKNDYAKEFLTNIYTNEMHGFVPIGDAMAHLGSHKKRSDGLSFRRIQNKYDIIFGVVTSEALWKFSAQDIQNGFEGEKRDRIMRTYVRNAYTYHLSEIFYTVVNEYTDWDRTVQHPINMRDATVAALSDAQYIAPLIQSGDLLSSSKSPNQNKDSDESTSKTFFYVFDYQTKDGDYPQRMGSVHGEELPYLFGAPLVDGFGHFPRNYTKSELALAESFMLYISNFARYGNPNEHFRQEVVLSASRERNRFRTLTWDEYDSVHQKYLEIGMKPRMKNHFRAHQLSVWLRLIPELHRAGIEDVVARHNLFRNHNDPQLYEGIVRPDPLSRVTPYETATDVFRRNQAITNNTLFVDPSITTVDNAIARCVTVVPSTRDGVVMTPTNVNDTLANLEAVGYAAYSTALSVTIAIGCSLLILNVLIFAGVYYQRDKALNNTANKHTHKYNKSFDAMSEKHSHYQLTQDASVILDIENQRHAQIRSKDPNFANVNFKGPVMCENSTMQINSGALIKVSPNDGNLRGDIMTLPHKHSSKGKNNLGYQQISGVTTLPKNISQQYFKDIQNSPGCAQPSNGSLIKSPLDLRRAEHCHIIASDKQNLSRRGYGASSESISTPHAAMNELGL